MKKEVTSIELDKHKINLTKEGFNKVSKCNNNDTVDFLGINFLVASEKNSYFPNMPIIIKPSNTDTYCLYMIDHLCLNEKNEILEVFSAYTIN